MTDGSLPGAPTPVDSGAGLLQSPVNAAGLIGVHNSLLCGSCAAAAAAGGHVPTASCVCTSVPRLSQLGIKSPQSSFDSNSDVKQISLHWMRMTGAIAPSKILNSDYGSTTSTPTAAPAPFAGGSSSSRDASAPSTAITASNPPCVGSIAGLEGSCHRLATVTGGAPSTSLCVFPPQAAEETAAATVPENCSLSRLSLNGLNMTVIVDDQCLSKRSLSLKSVGELELQRVVQDEARVPLIKDNERKEKGGRLICRQHLFHVRRVTSDFALLFSLMGIALMVVENELGATHFYERDSALRLALRLLIFASTLILICLVVKFHVHEIQLYMNANSVADWWIAMTPQMCLQLAVEVVVCSICPLPIDFSFHWATDYEDGRPAVVTYVPVDVLLSIPMFFRLYWVWRVMLQHSRLFTDNCNRSIAGLNRVNLNSRFILKILMTLCPGTMLMVFTASLWIIAGWVLRLCERHYEGDPVNVHSLKHQNYLNSLWLIAITFLSVGYGDIVPNTYCGRLTAVLVGILGTGTSSMVVAVIARKLELTRAEKHVHNFMMDSQLTKQLKHSAANVLRETWLIYKYRILAKDKVDKEKVRHHQRKFLVAIYALRKVKRDQRKLNENSASLGDVAKTTSNSYEVVRDIHAIQEGLTLRVTSVEHRLSDIQRELADLSSLLRAALFRQNSSDGPPAGSSVRRRQKHRRNRPTENRLTQLFCGETPNYQI